VPDGHQTHAEFRRLGHVQGRLAQRRYLQLRHQFLDQLRFVGTYVKSEGKLILNLIADGGDMVFASAGPVPYAELVEFGRAGVEE
jgi:hypothetical protein